MKFHDMLRNMTEDGIPTDKQGSFIQKKCRVSIRVFKSCCTKARANSNVHSLVCYLIWQNLYSSYGENLEYMNIILGTSLTIFMGDCHTILSTIRQKFAYSV